MKGVVRAPPVKVNSKALVVDRKAAVSVLKVDPVNLEMKNEAEQSGFHSFYQELLDTISYPVQIHSRQKRTGLDSYADEVEQGTGYTDLRTAYTDYCRQISEHSVVESNHYVTVRIQANQHESPGQVLHRRVQEVGTALQGNDLEVTQLTGTELRSFAEETYNPLPDVTRRFCNVPNKGFDEFRRLVYIEDYPSELSLGWPLQLLRVDGLVDIVQVLRPVPVDRATEQLRRYIEKVDAEINAFLAHGHQGVNRLERGLDDAEWFLDLLADQKCRPLQYGVYITAHAQTRKQVDKTVNSLKSCLRSLRIRFEDPAFRNDQAYYTDSPLHRDRLNQTLLTPSLSAATGFPFGTQPFEDQGVLYGTDTEDRTPILLNRFNWDSHSMAVIGTLGSGKSYSAQLELLRSILVYPELQVIVVDPKKEYGKLIEALGGENRVIQPGGQYCFNQKLLNFEVSQRGEFDNVAALVNLVQQIYAHTSQNTEKTLVLIDEARILLQDDAGRHLLNQFVLEARDINTAVHLVTQSGSHFTDFREGRDILDHTAGALLFRQKKVSDSMTDYFELSSNQVSQVLALRSGEQTGYSEAVLRVPNVVNTKIRIYSTEAEHRLIDHAPKQLEAA
jgi:hypothetical protein